MFDVLAAVVLVDRVSNSDDDVTVASVGQDSDPGLGGGRPNQAEEEQHHLLTASPPATAFSDHHVTAIDDCSSNSSH